ncbi:helix-turn-helix domain-containing protein [Pedobacter sp. MC2016-24]|uniref:helix-turn-helix domain-containing protein n=1 Tax=Pedobacter sp. MC2016-24 TaxID=2780090 RepID=UPI00188131FB|nr:helix-turn-helix domain-containing protein [Pedobacter sp. MC2016-24]MBE9602655.1 helix-turn-helix domain-containing protein [Pedobacter sp. MC2016-24]
MNTEDRKYTRAEAASYTGKSVTTLETYATRCFQILPFEKIGNRTYYKKSDLDTFNETRP